MQELRERIDVVESDCKMQRSAESPDTSARLRSWSKLYVQSMELQVAETCMTADRPACMTALKELRGLSIADKVTEFVNEEIGVTSSKKDKAGSSLVPLAEQLRGVLPKQCWNIMDESRAFDKADIILGHCNRGEAVNVIQVASAAAEAMSHLAEVRSDNVQTLLTTIVAKAKKRSRCLENRWTISRSSVSSKRNFDRSLMPAIQAISHASHGSQQARTRSWPRR